MNGRWERFWFERIPPHVYALLRIGIGLSGCAILLMRADLPALWDLEGFVPMDRGWRGVKGWLLAHDATGLAGRAVFVACVCAFIAMTLGLWSRVSVPLAFAAAMLQYGWNHLPMSGADDVLRAFLFCLIWTDCGAVWSMDAWRTRRVAHGAGQSPLEWASIAPMRLIQFQLIVIYLSAGLYKLHSPLWRDGSAVHYVLNSNLYQRFPYFLPPGLEWVTTVGTYATLFWELAFAVLVLLKSTRRLALIAGVLIHSSMFLAMEVGPFHLVMLAAYPAFVDPRRLAMLGRRRVTSDALVDADHIPVVAPPRV